MTQFEVFEISPQSPQLVRFRAWLDGLGPDLWNRLEDIEQLQAEAQQSILLGSLEMACLATNSGTIKLGRFVLQRRLPRPWVVRHFPAAAETILADPDQEWVFRRLLELYSTLDAGLLHQLVSRAQEHVNPEVREAAEEFRVP